MKKKSFKVIVKENTISSLKEVQGYFIWIKDTRIFVYYSILWGKWYVIDPETGYAFAEGNTLTQAKLSGYDNLEKFKNYQLSDKYKKCRFLYQKLKRGSIE